MLPCLPVYFCMCFSLAHGAPCATMGTWLRQPPISLKISRGFRRMDRHHGVRLPAPRGSVRTTCFWKLPCLRRYRRRKSNRMIRPCLTMLGRRNRVPEDLTNGTLLTSILGKCAARVLCLHGCPFPFPVGLYACSGIYGRHSTIGWVG